MSQHAFQTLAFGGENPANQGFDVVLPDGGTIATAYYCEDGEGMEVAEAYAHLFAAAPALLAACEAALQHLHDEVEHEAFRRQEGPASRLYDLLFAAVAKARGQQ